MMRPPALVLDGEERVALAVTRSLGRRGVPVSVAAARSDPLAGASRHATRRILMPSPMSAPDALAAELEALARREPGQVWFPLTDASLAVVDAARDRLAGALLPIPSAEALAQAWDKGRLLEVARTVGVESPRTWSPGDVDQVRSLAPALDYPVVLKPRRSRHRTAHGLIEGRVAYVHSAAELVPAWETLSARIPDPLIQERIPGYGMGIFLLADHGRVLARFAHRRLREKPPSGGVSVLSESIAVPPELAAAAERLLAALEWHGVCMIEFKVDARDGRPRLMEMNPRFWGSLALAIAAGVDFPWLLYQLAVGETPLPVTNYRVGTRLRWELGDLDHLLIRLRARDSRDLPPDTPSRLRAVAAFLNPFAGQGEVFRASDPGPALCELTAYVRDLRAPAPAAHARGQTPAAMGQGRRLRGAIHVHSRYSYDGMVTVAELARFFRGRGFDFICITEHSDGLEAADLEAMARDAAQASSESFLVIPGVEFSCRRRLHILGLGVPVPTASDDPFVVAAHVRRHDGLAVVAHPAAYGTDHPTELAAAVDGIEVWNITKDGWLAPGADAMELWHRWWKANPQLRGFAALDLHALDSPADLELLVEAGERSQAAIFAALRAGRFELRGRFLGLSGAAPPPGPTAWTLSALSHTYAHLRSGRDTLRRRTATSRRANAGDAS